MSMELNQDFKYLILLKWMLKNDNIFVLSFCLYEMILGTTLWFQDLQSVDKMSFFSRENITIKNDNRKKPSQFK